MHDAISARACAPTGSTSPLAAGIDRMTLDRIATYGTERSLEGFAGIEGTERRKASLQPQIVPPSSRSRLSMSCSLYGPCTILRRVAVATIIAFLCG